MCGELNAAALRLCGRTNMFSAVIERIAARIFHKRPVDMSPAVILNKDAALEIGTKLTVLVDWVLESCHQTLFGVAEHQTPNIRGTRAQHEPTHAGGGNPAGSV